MKNVVFYLGPASELDNRNLIITRMMRAGDDSVPAAASDQDLAGDTTFVTVALPDNVIWQATLQDTKSSGEVSRKQVLNFHTGTLQYPGPAASSDEGFFRIYAMEDLSSSSSSSSVSSSSSSSSASSASSSSSSQSSSSSSQSESSSSSSVSSVSSSSWSSQSA